MSANLSIVVPILNEGEEIKSLVKHLNTIDADEIILVDGGSTDGSSEQLVENWRQPPTKVLIESVSGGRGVQLQKGFQHSTGDLVLFLHADTQLPDSFHQELESFQKSGLAWGRFDLCFTTSQRYPLAMRVVAAFINWRSRWSAIATGDQAIFVRREALMKIGGVPQQPLMEDVEMSKRLKKISPPYCSRHCVRTSPRRWQQHGLLRTIISMWRFRFAYAMGASPQSLANKYYRSDLSNFPKKTPKKTSSQ